MGEDRRVLVVDDDEHALEMMAEFLPTLNCEVLLAHDGVEALQLFQAERPPLVLTDLQMPLMDGLVLMKAIKEFSPRTEILILTGHADLGSAVEAVRQGAFGYLLKPVDLQTLGRQVKQALERYRLVSEKEALLGELEQRVRTRTAALVESQQRLRAVFNAITDALIIVDQHLTVVVANQGAAALLGTPIETLVGRNCYQALVGREEICDGCVVLETFVTGRPASRAMSWRKPDGSFRYLEVSSYPLAYEGERPMEAVEHIRDITEKVHQARHLHNAEKLAAVGQLAAGLAHELGNALAIIGGSVQVLLKQAADPCREGGEYLEAIHRNVAAADRTIRGLLAFARPQAPCLEVVDLTESLDRACLLLRGEFAKHGVQLVKQYAPDLPRIKGDMEQLQQLFLNLLFNAIQAMDDGGTITISTRLASHLSPVGGEQPAVVAGSVEISVADTGRGIRKADLDRIFDPFFTTRQGGTGLGLSIAHRHVEAHRGRLMVESEEGKGTRFTIFLPTATPQTVSGGGGG
jgi:PAS domain S-box-containing protein